MIRGFPVPFTSQKQGGEKDQNKPKALYYYLLVLKYLMFKMSYFEISRVVFQKEIEKRELL